MAGFLPAGARRRWRAVLLLAIVAVHAGFLLWLALLPPAPPVARRADDGLISIALADPGGAEPRPRDVPAPVRATVIAPAPAPSPLPAETELPPPAAAADDPGAGAGATIGGCALAHDAGAAIASDPSAMAELDALPAGIRSAADAVMLWNGQWLANDAAPAGGALRRAVERVVLGSDADCRDAPIAGPQFVPVPEAGRTVMIVIGSGAWRWADLLPPPPGCAEPGAADCPTPPATHRAQVTIATTTQ